MSFLGMCEVGCKDFNLETIAFTVVILGVLLYLDCLQSPVQLHRPQASTSSTLIWLSFPSKLIPGGESWAFTYKSDQPAVFGGILCRFQAQGRYHTRSYCQWIFLIIFWGVWGTNILHKWFKLCPKTAGIGPMILNMDKWKEMDGWFWPHQDNHYSLRYRLARFGFM